MGRTRQTPYVSLLNLDEARRDTCFTGVNFLLSLDAVVDIFLNGQNRLVHLDKRICGFVFVLVIFNKSINFML